MVHHRDWAWQPRDVPHGQVRIPSDWPQAAQARPGVPDGRPRARRGDEGDQAGNLCGQSGGADSWQLQHHHGAGRGHRYFHHRWCRLIARSDGYAYQQRQRLHFLRKPKRRVDARAVFLYGRIIIMIYDGSR